MNESNISAMVIDDQETMHSILRQLLNKAGIAQIIDAYNGQEALETLREVGQAKPDVIICDLHMDKMDGMEFVNHLRRSKDTTPVLMLTGDTDGLMHEVSLQVGATKVLGKPISSDDLFVEICSAVGYQPQT